MQMKVFGFPTSPYVRKVLLVAAEKGVPVDLVPATPHRPTPEFLAASPFRMMPAIDDEGFTLADSTAIALYLEAKVPHPPLLPADPQARGRAMFFDEWADTILAPQARTMAFNRFIGPRLLGLAQDESAARQAEETLHPLLDWLERQLGAGEWLLEESFSLADLAVASCVKLMAYGMDVSTRPRIAAWYGRIGDRPGWQAVAGQERALVDEAVASSEHRQG